MEIAGKMNADVTKITIKANQAHDGREAAVDIAVNVKQEEATKKWGEEFATLAFSSLRPMEGVGDDEGSGLAFLQDKIRPSKKRFVCALHRIGIDDEVIETQPELIAIETVDGEARVIAHVRLPVDVSKKKLLSSLTEKVGNTVKIDFAVQQPGFKFKANGEAAPAPVAAR